MTHGEGDNEIRNALERIERDENVRILYAAESGSRAWGFASPDSDWDVRFVYVRPIADYVSIRPNRDVIELPLTNDLDVNGWDLLKALRLFRKSNPPLLEWLNSPIVYRDIGTVATELRELARTSFSPRRLTLHYLNMASGAWRGYIADREAVNLKKYLYVIRPLVCAIYVRERELPPPTSLLDALYSLELDITFRERLDCLLERKRSVGELADAPPDPVLNCWIVEQLASVEVSVHRLTERGVSVETLDAIVQRELGVALVLP